MLFDALIEHTNLLKWSLIAHFAIYAKDSLFWLGTDVTTVQSVTLREHEVLALWCNIQWLFFHVQIGAKVISTTE